MNPVILFRKGDYLDDDEIEAAQKSLPVYFSRNEVPEGSLVVGRYSVLPYYAELEHDLKLRGSEMVNTFRQHQFIADIREWTEKLGDMTFKTYARLEDIPNDPPPSHAVPPKYVVKGMTNSKKFQWNTHMLAHGKREAIEIASLLQEDSIFAQQDIVARGYVPLKLAGPNSYGFNGLPITEEFRFFVLDGKVISSGFYWSSHVGDLDSIPTPDSVPQTFLDAAMGRIGDGARFYALDVAKTQDDRWMVVEINDGQMSGLSENKAVPLYANLASALK